jgi:hypothetical protein
MIIFVNIYLLFYSLLPSSGAVAKQALPLQTNGFPNLRRFLAKRNLNLLIATANSIHNRTEHLDPKFPRIA